MEILAMILLLAGAMAAPLLRTKTEAWKQKKLAEMHEKDMQRIEELLKDIEQQ